MKKTYSEKLLDPRWQKKRLEILNRDNFTCDICGDTEDTLHVHHIFYEKGLEPWEYENEMYNTLCKVCHHSIEVLSKLDRNRYWMKGYKTKDKRTGHAVLFLQTLSEGDGMITQIEVFNHDGKQSKHAVRMPHSLLGELSLFFPA